MSDNVQWPRQALPSSRKTQAWGRKCLLWGDSRSLQNYSPVRKSVWHKQVNYDLLRGKLHMKDVALILNPTNIDADYFPEKIQHFPIMNSKLEVLIGEELKRPFDWRAVVTNMNAVSEIENAKKEQILASLRESIEDTSLSEEDYADRLEQLDEYFTYNYQDMREVRANEYLKHYIKEYNIPLIFNEGFRDALAVGEEIYICDIVGGEPTIERINPQVLRTFHSGRSNKIEDADIVIIEEYWAPGRILDTYYDTLTKRDIDYLENLPEYLSAGTDSMGLPEWRRGFVPRSMAGDAISFETSSDSIFSVNNDNYFEGNLLPYDTDGNVRVMRMFWKSKRKVLKVKSYDEETGEEQFSFYAENYIIDTTKGEESEDLWINEAWEGTLIGGNNHDFETASTDGTYGIFVNIRPRPVQLSRLSNPSKCGFGIVGTIYNLNGDKPYSMVDMMKPYNYLYDVIHFRLEDAIASSWGSLAEVDLALIPDTWKMDKWLYFAKVNHLAVKNSFNEGQEGSARGKLAGTMNNNSQRIVTDASYNYIQQLMNLAEYVKTEIGEIVGINRQREGQIANRETVGGVERATLQSSYITERYFAIHNDTKRRALNTFLEYTKIAARGKKIKFRYISSDGSWKIMEFDGDEYAENDYGIVIDSSSDILNLEQKIDSLASAALQTQSATLSDIMRMWSSTASLGEKIRILENAERKRYEQQRQSEQLQAQQAQQAVQAQLSMKQMELENQNTMNSQDNETKILVAQITADAKLGATQIQHDSDGIEEPMTEEAKAKLKEQVREFDLKIQQDNKKLELEKERNSIARISANRKTTTK